MRCRLFAPLVLLLAASLSSQTAPPAAPSPSPDTASGLTVADRKEIIRKARESYYSLKAEGLIEFQCQVLPDWDAIYKDQPLDPLVRDQLLPVLKETYFQVVFTPGAAPTVSPHSELTPPNKDVADRLREDRQRCAASHHGIPE